MTYLEDSAAELEKARADNEKRAARIADDYGDLPQYADRVAEEMTKVNDRRMEIAEGFTRLAAIEAGLSGRPAQPEESHP